MRKEILTDFSDVSKSTGYLDVPSRSVTGGLDETSGSVAEEEQRTKAITFSFDDGVIQDERLVALMEKYGLKGTFNLNTGIQDESNCFEIKGIKIRRMNQEGLDKLYSGHEIAVHGLRHLDLTSCGSLELEEELLQDAENIEKIYGTYPVGMAYPYGTYSEKVEEFLAKMGIVYGRGVVSSYGFGCGGNLLEYKPTCHFEDERLFEMAENFFRIPKKEKALFYIWGHSYELDVNNSWERLERFFQMVSGREDIFYGTNIQCFEMLWQEKFPVRES